jgi:hypothetical protein
MRSFACLVSACVASFLGIRPPLIPPTGAVKPHELGHVTEFVSQSTEGEKHSNMNPSGTALVNLYQTAKERKGEKRQRW